MTGTAGKPTTLSRASDHLGNLANVLKDLGGGGTLLHELTQNANDAAAERDPLRRLGRRAHRLELSCLLGLWTPRSTAMSMEGQTTETQLRPSLVQTGRWSPQG